MPIDAGDMRLTVREAARLLEVSEKTVYRWIGRGVVPAYQINGQYRFHQPELLEWAAARRKKVSVDILAEPAGEPRPRGDRLGLLRERTRTAERLGTGQAPLAPPQLDHLPARVKVLHPHQRSLLDPRGEDTTPRAGRPPLPQLDHDPQVAAAEPLETGDDELVFQPEQH